MKFSGPKDIKVHVREFLLSRKSSLVGTIVVDIPAGNGYSSAILQEVGATVEPYDLFPEFFKVAGLNCQEADLSRSLPISDHHADVVLCQEGVEHIGDQYHMFCELNRILKPAGTLLLTTPNYSNLRSRISYLLSESEFFFKIMPPNELDSIWFSEQKKTSVYFGHVFLTGIQKLRMLAKTAGFKIKTVHHVRVNYTALLLLPFFYPFILLVNYLALRRAVKKKKNIEFSLRKKIYSEVFKLGVDPRILIGTHLFIEFQKEEESDVALATLKNVYQSDTIVT